jgi:hypothetical protein
MFTFAYLKRGEINSNQTAEPLPDSQVEEDPYANITRVDAKHFLNGNEHTLIGELVLPTPCDLLSHETVIRESFPEQVEILFTVENESSNCIQVLSTQRFSVSVNVSPQASFSAKLNGRDIELNLIPANPDESPDDFEFVQKG